MIFEDTEQLVDVNRLAKTRFNALRQGSGWQLPGKYDNWNLT